MTEIFKKISREFFLNSIFKNIFYIFFFYIFLSNSTFANEVDTECEFNLKNNKSCILIRKTVPNLSNFSKFGSKKYVITSKEIKDSGARDINEILELVGGINITQSGPMGQQTSVFIRGTNSNHTLTLLNGIPINDQSTTQGLHDFGVDFIQNLHQVEVYFGPNSVHFGPSAIGAAINFVTAIDYENQLEMGGINKNNNLLTSNFTTVTENDWVLNLKSGLIKHKSESSKYGGTENDQIKNLSGNFNAEKWLNNNTKFRATVYGRETVSQYDNSNTEEVGYIGNNLMYATQIGLDHEKKDISDNITFHFHNYDREYNEVGTIDEYISSSFVTRGERKINFDEKISFGIGGEYKYEWGEFENRGSYSASTKGEIDSKSFFSNIGYKVFENTTISLYGRSDDHKTTGNHFTKKINLTHEINKLNLGLTHATGMRNPSIYELYGTDNYGYSGNKNLEPEKSISNEISGEYTFNKNFLFSLNVFKSRIFDHIEYKNNSYINNFTNTDLNQSGIESLAQFKLNNHKLSIFANSLSSKKTNNEDQLRRPEKTYGIKYKNQLQTKIFGPLDLILNYSHYGKHWDTHSSNFSTILMDSTDLIDMSLVKKSSTYNLYFKITNLADEKFQRPHGYSSDGRLFNFKLAKKY